MILTPPEYHTAHVMVFWLAGAAFLMGANHLLATGIWITRRTIFTSYAQFISFGVVIVSSFILVPRFQGTGAAAAFLIGTVSQSLAYYFFAQRLYHVRYRYFMVHFMVLCLILIGWINSRLVDEANLLDSLLIGLFTFCLSLVCVFILAFSGGQRRRIRSLVAGKISGL